MNLRMPGEKPAFSFTDDGGFNLATGEAPSGVFANALNSPSSGAGSVFAGGDYMVADSGQIISDAGRGFAPQINPDGLGLVLGADASADADVAGLNAAQSGNGGGSRGVSVGPISGSGFGGFIDSFKQGLGGDFSDIRSELNSPDPLIDPRALLSVGTNMLSFFGDGLIEAFPGSGAFEFGQAARARTEAFGQSMRSGISSTISGLADNLSFAYDSYRAGDVFGAGSILGGTAYEPTRNIGLALGTAGLSRVGLFADTLPGGATFEGTLYRAVGAGQDPLLIHPSNIANNHRYTGPGQGGLYFSTGGHVVEAEFLNNGSSLVGKQMYSFADSSVSDLLDLSSPTVRESLGVNLSDITRTDGTQAWRYGVTQPLGLWAEQNGYRGIIAPSAQADGGVNLILFNAKGVK